MYSDMATKMTRNIIARYYGQRQSAREHEAVGGTTVKMLKPKMEEALKAMDGGDEDAINAALGALKGQLDKLNLKPGM